MKLTNICPHQTIQGWGENVVNEKGYFTKEQLQNDSEEIEKESARHVLVVARGENFVQEESQGLDTPPKDVPSTWVASLVFIDLMILDSRH